MKNLILILWFVLFLSSSALAGVEYVTEEVCHAMAGCWVDTKTGECPDCVIERRKVVHTHEETPVIVEKPIVRINPNKIKHNRKVIPNKGYPVHYKVKKVKWTCVVGPCDFIDEDGNLIEKS